VTGTVLYVIEGDLCTLTASFTGTSNANTMTLTGIPLVCQPATQRQFIPTIVFDAGNEVYGMFDIPALVNTANFARGVVTGTQLVQSETGFTITGTKGVAAMSVTYSLL
jgi:hypothetical protein